MMSFKVVALALVVGDASTPAKRRGDSRPDGPRPHPNHANRREEGIYALAKVQYSGKSRGQQCPSRFGSVAKTRPCLDLKLARTRIQYAAAEL